MQILVEWLKSMESRAHNLYINASDYFKDDVEFSLFLRDLASDEGLHLKLMNEAADFINEVKMELMADITIDLYTKQRIEAPFTAYHQLLEEGKLSKEEFLNAIAEIEYSEMNEMFLYVIRTLKHFKGTFQFTAAQIQEHKKRMIDYVRSNEAGGSVLKKLNHLPNVWEKRMLVVDDNEALRLLFSELFKKKTIVEVSPDGIDALLKTKDTYFDVILSDIDMPKMNGIDFYKKATALQPELGNNFIFCSAFLTPDNKEFINKQNIPVLEKPVSLAELQSAVGEKLHDFHSKGGKAAIH